VLKAFRDAYKIGYPLLSDAGSKVIRAFGILNTNVPPEHKMLYGIPFPGDFLVGPDGTVRDKRFLPDYQHRPSASQLVLRNFDDGGQGNSVGVEDGPLSATISLSTDRCFFGQELAVSLSLRLKPGWHVYGRPLPGNYQPLELVFDGAVVGKQSLELPPARPMRLAAVGETLPVYEGEVRAVGLLGIKWSPPPEAKSLAAFFGPATEPGLYRIKGTLRFQACSDVVCEPPQAIEFELPLTIDAGVPAAPPKGGA
jgi:AhpC/TSA family/Thiol:disulfide interchange protein DsbD, N-terminal